MFTNFEELLDVAWYFKYVVYMAGTMEKFSSYSISL